jgi:hypothetical protein
MPGFFQEKSQISGPVVHNDDVPDKWASATSARQSQADVPSFKAKDSADFDRQCFNVMPPGMEISEQPSAETNGMPLVMSGESDVSKDTNPESFREGFKRVDMKGTDDLYTGEHTDLWYGDAGGFVERNNYLDRN